MWIDCLNVFRLVRPKLDEVSLNREGELCVWLLRHTVCPEEAGQAGCYAYVALLELHAVDFLVVVVCVPVEQVDVVEVLFVFLSAVSEGQPHCDIEHHSWVRIKAGYPVSVRRESCRTVHFDGRVFARVYRDDEFPANNALIRGPNEVCDPLKVCNHHLLQLFTEIRDDVCQCRGVVALGVLLTVGWSDVSKDHLAFDLVHGMIESGRWHSVLMLGHLFECFRNLGQLLTVKFV